MSVLPSGEPRQLWPLFLGFLVLALGMTGAVLMTSGDRGPEEPTRGGATMSSSTAETTGTDGTAGTPDAGALPRGPEVVRWGGSDGQLAVVVRNTADVTIARARVRITAYDADGAVLTATEGSEQSTCCSVLGLPPDREFGLFAGLDAPLDAVDRVDVQYLDVRTTSRTLPRVDVRGPQLRRTSDDAEVAAESEARGDVRGFIVGQAFLTDADGDLLGVISGRFYCFRDGTRRSVRMQLLRPVPPGARVERALAYPIPSDADAGVRHDCTSHPQETR